VIATKQTASQQVAAIVIGPGRPTQGDGVVPRVLILRLLAQAAGRFSRIIKEAHQRQGRAEQRNHGKPQRQLTNTKLHSTLHLGLCIAWAGLPPAESSRPRRKAGAAAPASQAAAAQAAKRARLIQAKAEVSALAAGCTWTLGANARADQQQQETRARSALKRNTASKVVRATPAAAVLTPAN